MLSSDRRLVHMMCVVSGHAAATQGQPRASARLSAASVRRAMRRAAASGEGRGAVGGRP